MKKKTTATQGYYQGAPQIVRFMKNEIGDEKSFNQKVLEIQEEYNSIMEKVEEIEKSIDADEDLTKAQQKKEKED